jgi:hypothetical protein
MNHEIYQKLIEHYLRKRQKHLNRNWWKIKSYFSRLNDSKNEFRKLLDLDTRFHEKIRKRFIRAINRYDALRYQDIEEYKAYLKCHVSKLNHRAFFIIVTVALSGWLASIARFTGDNIVLVSSILIILFLIIERWNIGKRVSAYEEIIHLIESINEKDIPKYVKP